MHLVSAVTREEGVHSNAPPAPASAAATAASMSPTMFSSLTVNAEGTLMPMPSADANLPLPVRLHSSTCTRRQEGAAGVGKPQRCCREVQLHQTKGQRSEWHVLVLMRADRMLRPSSASA